MTCCCELRGRSGIAGTTVVSSCRPRQDELAQSLSQQHHFRNELSAPAALWCSVVHIDEFPAPTLHGKYADHALGWVGLSGDLNAKACGCFKEGPAQAPQRELIADGIYRGITLYATRSNGIGGASGKMTGQHERERARRHCDLDHLASGNGHEHALDSFENSAVGVLVLKIHGKLLFEIAA